MSESNPEKKRKKTPTADGVARLTSLRRQVIGALILFLFAFFLWTRVETSSPPELSATKIEIPPRPILPATTPVEVDLPPIESSNFEPEFELESESKPESESEAEDASGDPVSAQAAAALPASVSARAVESESESDEESLAAGARKPFVAQVIAVADRARARATLSQLAADFEGGHLQRIEDGGGVLYRVGFGYDTIEAAERAKTLLRKLGYEKAFVRENPPR